MCATKERTKSRRKQMPILPSNYQVLYSTLSLILVSAVCYWYILGLLRAPRRSAGVARHRTSLQTPELRPSIAEPICGAGTNGTASLPSSAESTGSLATPVFDPISFSPRVESLYKPCTHLGTATTSFKVSPYSFLIFFVPFTRHQRLLHCILDLQLHL